MKPRLKLSDITGTRRASYESEFDKYSDLIDTETGTLRLRNGSSIDRGGIRYSSGHNYLMSVDELDRLEQLGIGNYGAVYKVRQSRTRRNASPGSASCVSGSCVRENYNSFVSNIPANEPPGNTRFVMAMKETPLVLDDNKLSQIIMELDILHRCSSRFIVDFYGAFFREGVVSICVEFMDAGSVDKLYKGGVPENILRKIALSTVMGLKSLHDDHDIIHRDVKPANILMNTRGQIKICDFGISGVLVAGTAKTQVGCQSYMAPERIADSGSQGPDRAYGVESDIWSLGLSIVECATGCYPYPQDIYPNIFSQLYAITHGEVPSLPEFGYSEEAHAFLRDCLDKNPSCRSSYGKLLRGRWLSILIRPPQKPEHGGEPINVLGNGTCSPTDDEEVADWVRMTRARLE